VKNRIQSLSFIATLAVVCGMISWGSALHAQTTSTPSDPQTQTAPTPTPDTPPSQQTPQTSPTPAPAPAPDAPPATQQTPTTQTPDASQQTPAAPAPDAAQPSTPKDSTPTAATPGASDSQIFSGTVVKSGDKYVLKDDSGKTYDIDHQDDVRKFEGKRVKVQGKLDDTGTKIMVK
jgi:outer membrane biosynthesis protein TonB